MADVRAKPVMIFKIENDDRLQYNNDNDETSGRRSKVTRDIFTGIILMPWLGQ
jgi:hypothetical protein